MLCILYVYIYIIRHVFRKIYIRTIKQVAMRAAPHHSAVVRTNLSPPRSQQPARRTECRRSRRRATRAFTENRPYRGRRPTPATGRCTRTPPSTPYVEHNYLRNSFVPSRKLRANKEDSLCISLYSNASWACVKSQTGRPACTLAQAYTHSHAYTHFLGPLLTVQACDH